MQILHIVSSLDPAAGGVSQAILTMARGLTGQGITNEAATIDSLDEAYLQNIPFTVHAFGPGKTAWKYAPALQQWLATHLQQYDAIIVHGLWQYPTYATYKAWKSLKAKRPKLFVMPHGMLDPYFQRASGRKLKAIRNWLFWKWNEHRLVNAADALLFTCETEKLLAREPFSPYRPKAEKVVGLGVETPPPYTSSMQEAFNRQLAAAPERFWLFISRIHPKKGVDLLITAYLQAKKERGLLPPLVIAGPGRDTEYGQQMVALAAADPQVYFPGMLTGDTKWGAFYGCEAFILPSHQENFGIAVVEALACGKPVLISNQVNIWREIQQAGAALVQPDTLTGTRQLLLNYLQLTSNGKQQLQRASRKAFINYFSETAATNQLVAVLRNN